MVSCYILGQKCWSRIQHSLAVWHFTKNLRQKLMDKAKTAGCRGLGHWIKDIINHFWYSASQSRGSVDRLRKVWLGMLSHIINVHAHTLW